MEDKLKYVLNALILAHLGIGSLCIIIPPAQIKPTLLPGALTVRRGALQRPNKKALENVSNAHLEELAGTAPASAGLSWLVVYRHSPFFGLSARIFKGTNIPSEQSKVLAAS